MAAAREAAAIAEAEAAAAEAEAAAAAFEQSELAGIAALNAPIIEDVGHRPSGSLVSTDTMEFAVAAATATLPFRDRIRARAGVVETLRFRIGGEFFATDLATAEEALERPSVHRVPEMADQMLGVFSLRGKLVPVFAPTRVLGAALAGEFGAALVLRSGDRRVALAIDDVEDVMTVDLTRLREIPAGSDPDGVLLAVAFHNGQLVSLIDADVLLAACQTEQLAEMT
jgi:chemotaxis signal transduction protein